MLSKYSKITLSFISVLLFGTSFWICKHVYPLAFGNCEDPITKYNVRLFTDLRYSIYAIFSCLLLIRSQIKGSEIFKLDKFILAVGIGLSIADIIDRYYFDITHYTKADKIMISITILGSYLETYTKYNTENIINKLCQKLKI